MMPAFSLFDFGSYLVTYARTTPEGQSLTLLIVLVLGIQVGLAVAQAFARREADRRAQEHADALKKARLDLIVSLSDAKQQSIYQAVKRGQSGAA